MRHFTAVEAADMLGVSPKTVRVWMAERRLRFCSLGPRTRRIPADALEEFVAARMVEPRADGRKQR